LIKKINFTKIFDTIFTIIFPGVIIFMLFFILYIEINKEKINGIDVKLEDGTLPINQADLPEGVSGYYSPLKNLIVCFKPGDCIHEIGHKVDDEKMWGAPTYFTETRKWKKAVDYYIAEIYMPTTNSEGIENSIFNFPGINDNPYDESWGFAWGGYTELYAEILQYSCSNPENMPEIFRKFYNWKKIDKLEKDYPEIEKWKKDCEIQLIKNLFDKN